MSHDATTANPYTSGMAKFVSGLRYARIPGEVIDRIKLLILDALGCAYGANLEWSRILTTTLHQLDSSTGRSVWGTSLRLSAPHAALAPQTAKVETGAAGRSLLTGATTFGRDSKSAEDTRFMPALKVAAPLNACRPSSQRIGDRVSARRRSTPELHITRRVSA
jgi:MmgE/PrpD N-terminal domain